MNGLYEDIDEDLDEMDDEDFGEDDELLAERRRRRRGRGARGVRGRGYNQPRIEKSYVTQAQLQAAMTRVGEDVRKLAASVGTVDDRVAKTRRDQNQFTQMALLLPMLSRPKSVEVKGTDDKAVKVLSAEQDKMSMLLPFLLLGGMGGTSTAGGGVAMIALGDK